MPLKLIPPGRRKGNRFYVARGRLAGRLYEFSTNTADPIEAERVAARFTVETLGDAAAAHRKANPRTFKDAADAYVVWRNPSVEDARKINVLTAHLGDRTLEAITGADLVAAAERLYPRHKPSSRNRLVIAPASAIIHYAAAQDWCPYRKFKRFKEPAAETRALDEKSARKLIAASSGEIRAFLTFLFGQGMRVTDALGLTWKRLRLDAGTVEVRIAKTDQWRLKALHPEALAELKALPATAKERAAGGPVFSYKNRWGVYRALEPVLTAAGVSFTPHMARHSLGKWLNASGAGLRTIMDVLDHADPKSSVRYQSTDVAGQRRALSNMKRIGVAPRKSKARSD